MTVKELIGALKKMPQDLPVAAGGELGAALIISIAINSDRYIIAPDEEVTGPYVYLEPCV